MAKLTDILKELMSDMDAGNKLYHHTSEANLVKILNSDTLLGTKPDDSYLQHDARLAATSKKAAISLTRDPNFKPNHTIGQSVKDNKTSDLNCVLVLSSNKLKTKYKVEPFNYDVVDMHRPEFKYKSKNKEYEDRVLTDKITPLSKYVVDIIYKGSDPKIKQLIDSYLNK